jgi:hypothetical protein
MEQPKEQPAVPTNEGMDQINAAEATILEGYSILTTNNELSSVSSTDSPLNQILEQACNNPLASVFKDIKKPLVTKDQAFLVIDKIARSHDISQSKAFAAVSLLFLKGAANSGAPPEMSVDILTENGQVTTICKFDLIRATQEVCKNGFIRRLGECLAKEISFYAETHNLNGDLAIRLDTIVRSLGKPGLTNKEKAWANSFVQNLPELKEFSGPRIPYLLAQDYTKRFSKPVTSKKQKQDGQPSRPKGPGKRKGQKQTKQS